MIDITSQARAELERFTQEELFGGEFIRIKRSYQCGGSKFEMTVDDCKTNMDETLQFDTFELVVEQTCLQLLNQCKLDFNENGFLFEDPLGNRC